MGEIEDHRLYPVGWDDLVFYLVGYKCLGLRLPTQAKAWAKSIVPVIVIRNDLARNTVRDVKAAVPRRNLTKRNREDH